jgi:hypothetical protein
MRAFNWIGILVFAAAFFPMSAQRFHESDPMQFDNDRIVDVADEPEEIELSDLYDRFGHIFTDLGDPNFSEAQNVNSLDEVPDSSWFTNRHGKKRMTLEELTRGANSDGPPDPERDWLVWQGKTQGVTPGFYIEEEDGDRYVIKFDPVHVPELATAAEAIASRVFYALGYNVPQNYIVNVNPDRFKIKPGTQVEDSFGDSVELTPFRLRAMLRKVPRHPDGTVRVTASRFLPGKVLGPFRYFGTRSDDPNDVIPHEHRRELRGLRLFAAWTNHDDTRAQNTQDTWEEENGRHLIRHYLMDFGSTFGSGSVYMQLPYLGFNWSIDLEDMKYHAPRLGIPVPEYRKVKWPEFPKYQAVGRWEGKFFDPLEWRNDYPNPAFVRATARDLFWAAKILMVFTEEELMAMVKTGSYSDPDNTEYFHRVLVQRQRKCGEFGINLLNPLDEFRVEDDTLHFVNLAEKYGFAPSGSTQYQVDWSVYDNQQQGKMSGRTEPAVESETRSKLPWQKQFLKEKDLLLLAEIRSLNSDRPHWKRRISVYLRSNEGSYEVVGIERESPPRPIGMK